MQYLIWKVSLMVRTCLVVKRMAVLLHSKKLIWKVPILLHTEQFVRIFFRLSVSFWLQLDDNETFPKWYYACLLGLEIDERPNYFEICQYYNKGRKIWQGPCLFLIVVFAHWHNCSLLSGGFTKRPIVWFLILLPLSHWFSSKILKSSWY